MNIKKVFSAIAVCGTMLLGASGAQAHVLDGAIEWNGHYYKSYEVEMNWKNAKAFCEGMGGHLVTIESHEENMVAVRTLVNGHKYNYWIGAYRDQNQMYRWISGKIVTDFYWEPGEPWSGGEDIYIKRESGQWAAHWETNMNSIICEWDSAASAHDSTL